MTSLLLLTVLFGSVILIVLMIYLGDRVKRLEIMSLQDSSEPVEVAKPKNDNGFLGLSGKNSGMQCQGRFRKELRKQMWLL